MRIAMWSGPRNLSTAMMYSFGSRTDCAVWDEPYYAAYLAKTGLNHPLADEIIAENETNPELVSRAILGAIPGNMAHFYQKHMTQHLIEGFDRSWMASTINVFLIRHPARVVASYDKKRERPTLNDLGFCQQADLFDFAKSLGQTPIVVDSADIRENPKSALADLCEKIGISFAPAMLSWPKGGHQSDGVWARHWYPAVHNSTGFAGAEGPVPALSGENQLVAEAAMPYYDYLRGKMQN